MSSELSGESLIAPGDTDSIMFDTMTPDSCRTRSASEGPMRASSSRALERPIGPVYWAHRILGGASTGPWTALVTTVAIALARLTGEPNWVRQGERLWARGLLGAFGVDVDVEQSGEIDPTRPYVVMSNHVSHVDVPILFAALPFVPGFLAKRGGLT